MDTRCDSSVDWQIGQFARSRRVSMWWHFRWHSAILHWAAHYGELHKAFVVVVNPRHTNKFSLLPNYKHLQLSINIVWTRVVNGPINHLFNWMLLPYHLIKVYLNLSMISLFSKCPLVQRTSDFRPNFSCCDYLILYAVQITSLSTVCVCQE